MGRRRFEFELLGYPYEHTIVLVALYLVGRVGRYRLSEILKIGEGRLRGIIKSMVKKGLIESKRGGSALTEKGKNYILTLLANFGIKNLSFMRIALNTEVYTCLYTNVGIRENIDILAVRDEAIRGGASMALIMRYNGRGLYLPPNIGYLHDYYPELDRKMRKELPLEPKEVLVAILAEELGQALMGFLRILNLIGRVLR
ncbi:MAG: hypothetical protein DRN53_00555 [Thermoprotei archaeon]|nr:MAG: hypothetical protein DRN53_00555 [Thermoprotei archaeon]